MPVFRLTSELIFPPQEYAETGGLLAVGGDLSPRRLLLAYSMGIFPWFGTGEPILWWCPDPRCILEPSAFRVNRSLSKELRRQRFRVTFDRAFSEVIRSCAEVARADGDGTWITADMLDAYNLLHRLGFAHSVEVWSEGVLVGGLYGIALGRCFFGESMFHRVPNASKVGFATLIAALKERDYLLVDCQQPSAHLFSFGAREIPRSAFLQRLQTAGIRPSLLPAMGVFPTALSP